MWCNQIFSLINDGVIQNIIVCDNYEVANQIARRTYSEDAFAIDTTYYPVGIGSVYIDGKFFDENNNEIFKSPTEKEKIEILEKELYTNEINQVEVELEIDARLSLLELGL